jgi:hypothetical protein
MESQNKDDFISKSILDFTSSWAERRGIESIDRNAVVTFIRVPLDRLSDVLSATAIETHRDVVGSEIEFESDYVFTYQIVGQAWSMIIFDQSSDLIPTEKQLSKQLGQPAIVLTVSDCMGTIGYFLYEDGEIIEEFSGEEGDVLSDLTDDTNSPGKRYVLSPELKYPEYKQSAYFWSQRRHVTAEEIGNIWDFPEQFMIEYKAYDPDIDLFYLLGEDFPEHRHRYQVQNPGFTLILDEREITSVPDLVRVDYFRFGA